MDCQVKRCNNYLHEILRIDRAGRGAVEFPRELPAIAMMVVWSMGEHLMMPLRQSVAVHMARPGREGHALGTVTGMQNLGQLAGYYLIPAVFALTAAGRGPKSFADYRTVFFLGAVVFTVGLLLSLRLRVNNRHMAREKLTYAPKFKKYYLLEMFFGARKQVFLSFAPYVLILIYGAGAETLAVLYGISATLSILMSSLVGRIIDRFGYRVVLAADALLLVLLCVLYGFSHSINHLVSIVITLTGGLLWEKLGIEVLFTAAGIFGVGSFLFSLTLPGPGSVKRESCLVHRASNLGIREKAIIHNKLLQI